MRTLSGIQPTGNLHLGNYLGAIRNWVRMQDEMPGEKLYFLADLHAITSMQRSGRADREHREMAAALMPRGSTRQGDIVQPGARARAHAELGWLLFCTARIRLAEPDDPVRTRKSRARTARAQASGFMPIRCLRPPTCSSTRRRTSRSATTRNSISSWRATLRPVQPRHRHRDLHPARTDDSAHRGTDHEPARRQRQNVEIGPERHEPDQSGRRCRHRSWRRSARQRPTSSRCRRRRQGWKRRRGANLVSIYAAMADESIDDVLTLPDRGSARSRRRSASCSSKRCARSRHG